jgi:hypothetical protein
MLQPLFAQIVEIILLRKQLKKDSMLVQNFLDVQIIQDADLQKTYKYILG